MLLFRWFKCVAKIPNLKKIREKFGEKIKKRRSYNCVYTKFYLILNLNENDKENKKAREPFYYNAKPMGGYEGITS